MIDRFIIRTGVLVILFLAWYVFIHDGKENIGEPEDSNRIFHDSGFSIIVPQGWATNISLDTLLVERSKYQRIGDSIQVCRGLCDLYPVGEYQQSTFLGMPATVQHRFYPSSTFETPAHTRYTIVIPIRDSSIDDDRLVIRVLLKGEYDAMPLWLEPFLNSLQIEKPKVDKKKA